MTAMNRLGIRGVAWALLVCALTAFFPPNALGGQHYGYTYTYDFWGDVRYSPDAYRVSAIVSSKSLGLDKPLKAPQGMFALGESLYLCDTGNNRILEVIKQDGGYGVKRIIEGFKGEISPLTFSAPQDVFVNTAGEMYICDMGNGRVLKLDKDLNHLLSFTKPSDVTFDQSLSFLPTKVVADTSGRAYVLGRNVNKGIIKYEKNGAFSGFVGASKVSLSFYDVIWRMLSTQAQRARQTAFVPTEYSNITIDKKGFFYVVTKTFNENLLFTDEVNPIRRLNPQGTDILIRNGNYAPAGDVQWSDDPENLSYNGASRFEDIAVLDGDIYVALDGTRSRLFGYDEQGNMLWVFGGVGNMDGYFAKPVALDHVGKDLLVLDAAECSVTIMTPTAYGDSIYLAIDQYRKGDYFASADTWREVLRQNANLDLAYIGVGRALIQQGEYEEALSHFRVARDSKNYSEAWRFSRKMWVEDNIGILFALAFGLLILPPAIRRIRKIKREVEAA